MYNKNYKYSLHVSRHEDNGIRIVHVNIDLLNLREWCIALMMVRYELEPLTLLVDGFTLTIQKHLGESYGRSPKGYYFESSNQGRLEVDTDYIDKWLSFYLSAIQQNGDFEDFSPDHLDEQFYISKQEKKSKAIYLTMSWKS